MRGDFERLISTTDASGPPVKTSEVFQPATISCAYPNLPMMESNLPPSDESACVAVKLKRSNRSTFRADSLSDTCCGLNGASRRKNVFFVLDVNLAMVPA